MAQRQLERLENQNKIFESDSLSDESSDGEEKKVQVISGASNSFDNSREISNNRSTDNNNTRTSMTAKSQEDSAVESSTMQALRESLESFQV